MKIAIVGVGAVGTYLACRLGQTRALVSVAVRKEHRATIAAQGLTMTTEQGDTVQAHPRVIGDDAPDIQDCVLVSVKAYAVPGVAADIERLLGPHTCVAFVQNGIPWWYRLDATAANPLDPDGHLARLVPAERIIGAVAYVNVQNRGPGRAHHVSDDTYVLGRPDGRSTPMLEQLATLMRAAGLEIRVSERIQKDIWQKLWGSLAFNPISALTGATLDRIIAEPSSRPIVVAMMSEARAVAERAGVRFDISVEQRLEAAARAGAFKTSMLQDLEAGRRMEIDAILGAVSAAAHGMRVQAPTIDVILGLLTQKAKTLGLH